MKLKTILWGLLWGGLCWASVPPVKFIFTHEWDPSYYNVVTLAVWLVGGLFFDYVRKKIQSRFCR